MDPFELIEIRKLAAVARRLRKPLEFNGNSDSAERRWKPQVADFGPCKIEAVANTAKTAVQHSRTPDSREKPAFRGAFRRNCRAVFETRISGRGRPTQTIPAGTTLPTTPRGGTVMSATQLGCVAVILTGLVGLKLAA